MKLNWDGQVLNHSNIELLIVETNTGHALIHKLAGFSKSPKNIDADGFKRADEKSILGHSGWWKIAGISNIFQVGSDLLIPVSIMIPVSDNNFGITTLEPSPNWGEKLTYVREILYDKNKKIVGYLIDKYGQVSVNDAIKLAQNNLIDNVVIVKGKNNKLFLRTKKNVTILKNLT